MNYLKLQQELLKAAESRDGPKHKQFDVHYSIINDRIWVFPHAFFGMGIPLDKFYLDVDKIWKDTSPLACGWILKDAENAKPAVDTNTSVILKTEKKSVHKFIVNDESIFVNEKYLNYFNDSCFKGTNGKSPLFVYEFDELVGMILPIKLKENI